MASERKGSPPAKPTAVPPGDGARRVNEFDSSPSTGGFGRIPTGMGRTVGGGTGIGRNPLSPGYADRAPRARVVVPVRYRYQSILDFVETQSINVSRSGMYITCDSPLPVGTVLQFEFALSDGFVLLKGTAEVTRAVTGDPVQPAGMGLRFMELEEKSRTLIERIVEVNEEEGKEPTVALDFTPPPTTLAPHAPGSPAPTRTAIARAVHFYKGDLKIVLSPMTAGYFTYNPLLNIKMGGFVVPSDEDVPLGTVYAVRIVDMQEQPVFIGKGKVVAKQDKKLGIRLTDPDKPALVKLQAEANRLAPPQNK